MLLSKAMSWILLLPVASAFLPPHAIANTVNLDVVGTSTPLLPSLDHFLLVSQASLDPTAAAVAAATAGVPNPSTLFNGSVGDLVKNIALGITAVIFALAGVTYIAAAVLVPAGAQQLEIECTALIPDTWKEYLGKLEEGQEMKDRPDLMFELGLMLNKCKADRLEQVCLESQLAPDLWKTYQGMLAPDQELQDRPELIAALNADVGMRAAQVLKENTSVCPSAKWEAYELKAEGKEGLADRPDLLEELAVELGYSDLLAAVAACLLGEGRITGNNGGVVDAEVVSAEDDFSQIASTISGITEIRRKDGNQWDE
mmetsp:Transcript_15701/g.33959  ORF Transcript_15701/g.33959 Transcript_15701/m.33959 type:complete len:314 (-) Transcript_15701:458-1399(-)